jgi:predicted transcriptional regulator
MMPSDETLQAPGRPQLGELELSVLGYISDHSPATIRDVADSFGADKGLARTTILTVIERLRQKGYLTRAKHAESGGGVGRRGGVYVYTPAETQTSVLSNLVRRFVDRTLDGSLTPFVAYLVDSKGLSPEEADQLRELLDR